MSGHTENGVYSLVHDMKEKQFYCNMTDTGGWTIIQRRSEGIQDFDRGVQDFTKYNLLPYLKFPPIRSERLQRRIWKYLWRVLARIGNNKMAD